MALQTRLDVDLTPLVRGGQSAVEQNAILLTDAGRATPLVFGTLLAKVAASGKYVPFINEAAVDGTALPSGIYIGPDIAAADIVAGDILDIPVLVGNGVYVDENKITIENSKLMTTVIGAASPDVRTVKDQLRWGGIFTVDTVDISSFEN
jgi:hypothetical protein